MKRVKQAAYTLLMLVLLCGLLTVPAFAAGEEAVWVTLTKTSEGTAAAIVTDTTVTDGVVELTYDSTELTYEGVTVTEAYAAMYSVNAEEAGVVRISWVAPCEYEADPEGASVIQVSFTGEGDKENISLTGSANKGSGEAVPVEGVRTPGTEEPGTDQPGTDQPGTNQPGTDQPGTSDSGTNDTNEPGTDAAVSNDGNGGSGTAAAAAAASTPATGDASSPAVLGLVAVMSAAVIVVMKKRRGER